MPAHETTPGPTHNGPADSTDTSTASLTLNTTTLFLLILMSLPTLARGEDWRLSTAGLGPAKIGMRVEAVERALGRQLVVDGDVGSTECYYTRPVPDINGLTLMVSNGRVVRFDVRAKGLTTLSGLGVGDSHRRVLEVLGDAAEVTEHEYLAPEGAYITLWASDGRTGIRFETHRGTVIAFHAGRADEVTQVEGCS
jgi:hypothetical protein